MGCGCGPGCAFMMLVVPLPVVLLLLFHPVKLNPSGGVPSPLRPWSRRALRCARCRRSAGIPGTARRRSSRSARSAWRPPFVKHGLAGVAGDGRREFLDSASPRPRGGADLLLAAGRLPLGRDPHRRPERAHVPSVRDRRCGPGRRRRPLRRRPQPPALRPHPQPVRLNGGGERSVRHRRARDVRPTRRRRSPAFRNRRSF